MSKSVGYDRKIPAGNQLMNLFLCILVSSIIVDCAHRDNRQAILIGTWDAQWETSQSAMPEIPPGGLKMQGLIVFNEDGTVRINAYGHKDCIFARDTLSNLLQWQLEEQTLRFVDQGDDTGLPYTVDKLEEDCVKLVLMDDIFLTLTR